MGRWMLAAGVVAALVLGALPAGAAPGNGNRQASVTVHGQEAFVQVSAQGGDVQVTVMDGWREQDYAEIRIQVKDKVDRTADPPVMMFADAF